MPNVHSSISFALVNIPVVMNPIVHDNDTTFNQLHKKCNHRIKYIKFCPYCKKDVKENEIVKGYEYETDKYLIFNKEDLNKLKLENEKEIEIISFLKLNEVDPIYFEKTFFLETETKSKAYLLFCKALENTKRVALAKTVIGTKFYYCLLRFNETGIVLTTLYFAEEIDNKKEKIAEKVNEKELELAIKLIENLKGKFEPEKYKDEYQNKIKNAIDDKLNGKPIKKAKKTNKKQVNDLMKALKESLKSN